MSVVPGKRSKRNAEERSEAKKNIVLCAFLSIVSKIFENLIHDELVRHFEKSAILTDS